MSQEEEKLIKTFEDKVFEEIDRKYLEVEDFVIAVGKIIFEAYRYGKLAGFEQIERIMLNPIIYDQDKIDSSTAGFNSAVIIFKNIFEEEKKKL